MVTHPPPAEGSDTTPTRAMLALYRARAAHYDDELTPFEPLRQAAIDRLQLRPGQTVLDVGCGTGLSLAPLLQRLGPQGRIVGIEQSPEMIEQARRRVARARWARVTLICSPVETADIRTNADAALFHFTHDVLRRPEAIANVLQHLKPGARVVATGLQWADPWAWPVNLFVWGAALRSVSTLDGLIQPWSDLAAHVPGLDVRSTWMGGIYIASGTWPGHQASPLHA